MDEDDLQRGLLSAKFLGMLGHQARNKVRVEHNSVCGAAFLMPQLGLSFLAQRVCRARITYILCHEGGDSVGRFLRRDVCLRFRRQHSCWGLAGTKMTWTSATSGRG